VNGPNVINQKGMYAIQGTAAAGNVPGARYDVVDWTDATGNFWLFSGIGYDSTGTQGELSDLWDFELLNLAQVVVPNVVGIRKEQLRRQSQAQA
jgi:hypothetical protein